MGSNPDRARTDAEGQFEQVWTELGVVVGAGLKLDRALTGRSGLDDLHHIAATLFSSVMGQAISLQKVMPRPKTNGQLFDIISTSVIVRAMAETYISLRYVAMEPDSTDEMNFRLKLQDYHRAKKTHAMAVEFNMSKKMQSDSEKKLKEQGALLQAGARFMMLSAGQQRKLLDGNEFLHRGKADIAAAARMSKGAWATIYTYLSQYAHAAPFSTSTLRTFNANSADANTKMSLVCRFAAGFLAKFIEDIETLYPGCADALSQTERENVEMSARIIEGFSGGVG